MNALELRNKLINLIKTADVSSLKKIESFLVENEDFDISDEHKLILDKRLELHKDNPQAGKSLNITKEELALKYGI